MNQRNLTDRERQMYAATGRLFYATLLFQGFPEMLKELQTEEGFIELGIQAFQILENQENNGEASEIS